MLNISIWNIACTVINILVLYLFLKYFLFGPISRIMEERKAMIEADLDKASQAKEEAEQMKGQYEASIGNAEAEAARLIADAKAKAGEAYDKIMEQARLDSSRQIEDAEKVIALEREKAMSDLQAGVAGLAMTAAARLLREQSRPEDDRSRYTRFLAEAGEGND